MTATLEPPPVESPDAGVIEEARARQRRHRSVVVAAAVVTIGAALIAGFAGGGGGSASSRGRSSAHPLAAGKAPSLSDAACTAPRTISGSPSRALVSILSVLRGQAITTSALSAVVPPFPRPFGIEVYGDDVHRAREFAGVTYDVVPVHFASCSPSLRRGTDGIYVVTDGGGGGGGGAAQIETGDWYATTGPGIPGDPYSATVEMIVPDGVASVTLHYPAGPASGYEPNKISPPFTATTTPINNLVLVDVPRSSGGRAGGPVRMIWRAADGHTIKTFSRL